MTAKKPSGTCAQGHFIYTTFPQTNARAFKSAVNSYPSYQKDKCKEEIVPWF